MEQAKHLMWSSTRRSSSSSDHHQRSDLIISSPVLPIFASESWELERAFAVDHSAGNFLGGCPWPPTSYTCSFCRREFRSAQALGGHMNVHRRDRAKLKQSSICAAAAEEISSKNICHDREETVSKKRRQMDNGVFPFYEWRSELAEVESEVHKFSPNPKPVEELDLELRLGICYTKKLDQQSCKDISVLVERN